MLKNKKSEFLFPTQVAIADIENFTDFQDDLVKWIYEYKTKDSGISRISVGAQAEQFARDAAPVEAGAMDHANAAALIMQAAGIGGRR